MNNSISEEMKEQYFKKVRAFLEMIPGSSKTQVSRGANVPIDIVQEFLDEGRINARGGDRIYLGPPEEKKNEDKLRLLRELNKVKNAANDETKKRTIETKKISNYGMNSTRQQKKIDSLKNRFDGYGKEK